MRTSMIARHLLAITLLPGMVAGVVPACVRAALAGIDSRWPPGPVATAGRLAGLVLGIAGLSLVVWCVALFARIGQGTLAPWDPTRHLVVVGPYRHVRNPMISGVGMLLAAPSLWLGSWLLATWLTTFVVINHVFFLLVEEPGLVRRFGDAYRAYADHVPRWWPRRTPWPG